MKIMAYDDRFYEQISPIDNISQIVNPDKFSDIPEDWYIALSDIRGSTRAISEGRYKDVNAIASATIAAILNIVPHDIPFLFGGDGATILVPPNVVEQVRSALIATQQLAQGQFDLQLRIGLIPVADILAAGYGMRVAKLWMSDNFQQAIFSGGGITYAERLLKDPDRGKSYVIESDEPHQANYSGFECRWNAIPSPYDETISLIVNVIQGGDDEQLAIYREVINWIDETYGSSEARHPIAIKDMRLAWNPNHFKTEARIRHQTTHFRQLLRLAYSAFKGRIAIAFNIQNWGIYKSLVVAAVDNEKFDDTLRMIISGSAQQSAALRAYLEEKRQQGQLVYGIHVSTHTLMTCIVFDYFGRQVHFVDGADGGYAMAALEMKNQLKEQLPGASPADSG